MDLHVLQIDAKAKETLRKVRVAYENFFGTSETPFTDLMGYVTGGGLSLYVSFDEEEAVLCASFVTTGFAELSDALFQSYFFWTEKGENRKEEHLQAVLAELWVRFPQARLFFEVVKKPSGDDAIGWASYLKAAESQGAKVALKNHNVPGANMELWAYPATSTILESDGEVSRESAARVVYLILRYCYGLEHQDAIDYLRRDELPTKDPVALDELFGLAQ